MSVTMENDAGQVRQVKVGFSWAALFFGGIPFVFRSMPVHATAWLLLSLVTLGLSHLFLGFLINKYTALYYLEHGYRPTGKGWDFAGAQWRMAPPMQGQRPFAFMRPRLA